MNDEFEITVDKIRKEDSLFHNDKWRRVTKSHMYLGPGWNRPLENDSPVPIWVVRVAKTDDEWDWSTYPTYGMQPNDSYDPNGPEMIWPLDCTDEILFYDNEEKVLIQTDKVEVLGNDLTPIRWWVGVFEISQAYGGPEEGGWWTTCGEVKQVVPANTYEEAEAIRERLALLWPSTGTYSSVVYGGGDYGISICKSYPKNFPDRMPVYC